MNSKLKSFLILFCLCILGVVIFFLFLKKNPEGNLSDNGAPNSNTNIGAVIAGSNQTGSTGNTPKDLVLTDTRFPKVLSLYSLPELAPNLVANYKILKPSDYTSWSSALQANPNTKQFLMTPGNYTNWGVLVPSRSGTATAPIIVRYYDPNANLPYNPVHPVELKKTNKEVILEGFKFENDNYWILHGVTFRGKSDGKGGAVGGAKNSIINSDHIVIDYSLFENVTVLGIRVVNGSYNYIQNNVFRQLDIRLNGDGGAVGIQATRDDISGYNVVSGNEIIDFNDGIGLPREGHGDTSASAMLGDTPGNVFEGNDIYITSINYTQGGKYACAENAFDFKNGTTTGDRVRVVGNRMWGFRPSDPTCGPSGSNGTAISLHRNAKNITIDKNIFFDIPIGVNILGSDKKFPGESMSGLIITNNILAKFAPLASTTGFVVSNNVTISNNTISGAGTAFTFGNTKKVNPIIQNNLLLNIQTKNTEVLATSNVWLTNPAYGDYTFYRKKWTGPEAVTFSKIIK